MADSYIQVAPDSTGKQMQTYLNTISAQPVHAEAVVLVDSSGNPITTLNVNIGTSTLTVSGNVAATQSGTWNIGVVTSITNTVTVTGPITNAQLRASEVSISAANLPLPALASTSTKQSDGSQKTQICDPINVSNIAGITSGALNVYLNAISATANLNTTNTSVKMFTGAPSIATGQVAATNVSATLVAARGLRRSVTIRNLDTTNSGYIGPAPIGTTNGMLLQPKESISIDFTGLIAVITPATAGGINANFAYIETYD